MARLSRRGVVAGMASTPLVAHDKPSKAVQSDPVLLLCAHYENLARRQDALMHRWGDHEEWLARNYRWFSLSAAERRALPEAGVLDAIDEEYDRCLREGVRVVRRLRSVPAVTIEGAAAKLGVVAKAIDPDDYPSAHRVLLSVIADLRAISRS